MAEHGGSPSSFKNLILARLSPHSGGNFIRQLKPVTLDVKQNIYQPNEPMEHVYFVETGMISVVSTMGDGRSIEVGTIGNEGLAGSVLLLGTASLPYHVFVQMSGDAYRADASALVEAADGDSEFRNAILRYQSAFLMQTMQIAACNGLHSITQRCCRWLLMSQDRVHTDIFPLTHEFIAIMLGVRRASITEVLGPLQDHGWIESNRVEISILNRPGLETGSCECYRVINDELKRSAG